MLRTAAHSWGPSARLLTERAWRLRSRWDVVLQACLADCRPGTLAVDVGAADGVYALGMRSVVGRQGRVLALEPNAASFRNLRRRTWASGVQLRQCAVSDAAGTAVLAVPRGGDGKLQPGLGSLATRGGGAVPQSVSVVDLDSLLCDVEIEVSMVKIDVEGWEHKVVSGASYVLDILRPTLVIEIEDRHLRYQDLTVFDVVRSIRERGYTVKPVSALGISWAEFDPTIHQASALDGSVGGPRYINNFRFAPQ